MDFSHQLTLSYYKTIAVINESHKIYLVQHRETGQIYVKKILDVFHPGVYRSLLEHPVIGIPKIIDCIEEEHQLILIEEYISGTSLQEKIERKELTIPDILDYIRDLCNILEHLHLRTPAIIHRDIKPSNIIITHYNRAVLLDFNAAKYYSSQKEEDTVLLGTQGYAAPEQYGFGASSPQTDIYSLGILFKEMILSVSRPTPKMETIITKCTQMNPLERYPHIGAFRKDLMSLIHPDPSGSPYDNVSKYTLPGFRTKTPWKMLLASCYYLFISWMCLSMEIKNTYGIVLWLEKIFFFGIFLFLIFGSFNYLDIQKYMPLCKFNHPFLRLLGIIILNTLVIFSILILLFLIEEIFFPFR